MEGIAVTVTRIGDQRRRILEKRRELRRLIGAVESRLRSIVEELGNPIDAFTGDPLLTVTHQTRPENEHAITLRAARDWVLEFGIHDREQPLVIGGEVQRQVFGLYIFTNARDTPFSKDRSVTRFLGVGEEAGAVVLYERARPDADNLKPVALEHLVQDFLNAVEWICGMDLLNYNRVPSDH